MKQSAFEHVFVDTVPPDLDEGKLYISIRYRTASHLCACGCGNKVVTPIKPPKWHLHFDGASVSLWPSIGRWQLPCRSHYWIEHGNVRWSKPWTPEACATPRICNATTLGGIMSVAVRLSWTGGHSQRTGCLPVYGTGCSRTVRGSEHGAQSSSSVPSNYRLLHTAATSSPSTAGC
jgi:hypothetical protein